MITLTAEIKIEQKNPQPFIIGKSRIGLSGLLGETINVNAIFDKKNILSLNGEVKERADIQKPSWGIISNGGSLSFKDKNHRFLGYANAGILKEGYLVRLYLSNTISKKKSQVAEYYTSKWDYDNDNLTVNVQLKDDLEEWQDIYVDGIDYDPRKTESKTMEYFYNYLHEKTPGKYKMLPFEKLDGDTRSWLSGIEVLYPLLESGNLWSQWTKMCECCGLYIFKNKNGETTCKYSKGS